MSAHDALPIELVPRSRSYTNPYQSRMLHYENSQPTTVQGLPLRNSTSGKLELLPVELLWEIFLSVDFQALRCLRLVNFTIKQLVEALLAYRDLVTYAPNALRALAETDLLPFFDANHLHNALLSDRCASCNDYGPVLFSSHASGAASIVWSSSLACVLFPCLMPRNGSARLHWLVFP